MRALSKLLTPAALALLLLSSAHVVHPTPAHAQPMASPHGGNGNGLRPQGPPQNISQPAADVPRGEILVEVVDANRRPVPGATVSLQTIFQSVAEGNSDDRIRAKADQKGQARFSKLDTALRYTYAVEVELNGAKYPLPAFRMTGVGHRVVIHTFPVTNDVFDALVAASGMTQISLREDFFRVDVMYRVINLSQKTWLPQGMRLKLPPEAMAIDTKNRSGDAGFKEDDDGTLSVVGTFPPGHQDIQFSFQIPNQNRAALSFEVGVPFHLLEYVVIAEQAPGMTMNVPGFPQPENQPGRDGKPTLFAHRNLRRENAKLDKLTIDLEGLPTIGPGRWVATFMAALIALGTLMLLAFRKARGEAKKDNGETNEAREVLLNEMVLLEKAHAEGVIGPRTYEQTKREIVTAIARLEPLNA